LIARCLIIGSFHTNLSHWGTTMTKFRTLTGLLLLLGGGSAASAADLGIAPAPVAPDSFWDGFYAGIHAGAGGGATDKYFTSTGEFRNAWDLSGGLLGVHAGAATSIDQLVLGVEADLDFANITGDDAAMATPPKPSPLARRPRCAAGSATTPGACCSTPPPALRSPT
jgi:hypothetical protein